ncbi:hypothetical protein BJ138DRAFT_1148525 [Hygrophoropsis aurantiaca]|uniref:Uncharacterized protein n=1 Tax=Hygrophoropsis aurantiaca TaxID=72124 RepID=A0ACB8AGC1_9AGAM|nr:hypothetical protein BJ138DRAFT_1148525 [Hygrophoropsis aurantiaca]
MAVFEDLPFDVLREIISYLPIRNTLHLRQVSKHLQQITRERSIWSHAYRASSLVRPQGPFPWQTAAALESILVRSARLALNWPPNPDAAPVRSRVINIGEDKFGFQLVYGRWLLVLNDERQSILCFDLDRSEISAVDDEEPFSILYKHETEESFINSLSCVTPISNEGDTDHSRCIFLAMEVFPYLGVSMSGEHFTSLILLETPLDLSLCFIKLIPNPEKVLH